MQINNFLKFQVSEQDYIFLCQKGSRIMKLVLGGVTVIEAKEPFDDLGSGSYLMYPWVNRLEKPQAPYSPQFIDGNGLPLHGIVVNTPMSISSIKKQNINTITVKVNKVDIPEIPNFTQVFTLEPKKITIHMNIEENSKLPVCFGYHPYLQINDQNIVNLTIETNIVTNIKLDEKTLLLAIPIEQQNTQIKATQKYDSLFKYLGKDDAFLRLNKPGGHSVQIRSSDMKYWQVYTPPDGKRIAVEPMTFMGNLYSLYIQEKYGKLTNNASFTITVK